MDGLLWTGYDIKSARAKGAEISPPAPATRSPTWLCGEIVLPADSAVELVLEYGGFPQELEHCEATQGSPEISGAYLCLENQNLMPYLAQCSARGQDYPTTVELTVPGSMTVIPFGTSEAEVVETHGNGTATWRYEDDSAGGIVYAGDYIRQGYPGRRRRHPALLWPEASGGDGAGRGGGCGAVRGGLLHRSATAPVLQRWRLSEADPEPGGGGATPPGAPACWMRWTSLPPISATAAKGAVPGEVMIHELVHQWWGLGNMFDSEDPAVPGPPRG